MTIQESQEGKRGNKKAEDLNISCLAFADDTTFIANSQHNMQEILNKANEFYCINDIDINSKKSELLVINANAETTQKMVKLGRLKTEVKALEKEKAARFLEV